MVTMASSSFFTVYSMFFMFLLGVYFVKMEFFKNMEAKKSNLESHLDHLYNRFSHHPRQYDHYGGQSF